MYQIDDKDVYDALRLAIAIGPRCGSESLYHVIKWREQGLTLDTIAENVGITKGAVWNALKKADVRVAEFKAQVSP